MNNLPKRALVCGGRDFTDYNRLERVMDRLSTDFTITAIIEGDARGADRLAGQWAQRRGIPDLKFPANWNRHGRAAGFIRNKQMLDEGKPDLVIAFPGGRGTDNMIEQAKLADIPVIQIIPAERS